MHDLSSPLSIKLSIPSEFGYECVVREAVASFARRIGIASERVEDLKTAVSEACLNAIEHGNAHMPGMRIDVNCVWENDVLMVRVIDQGLKRYAGHVAPCIECKVQGEAPLRGMGLFLIAQLVDTCGFESSPDGGNVWYMSMRTRAMA
ncbi:MAG: ATP-binding protein [Roseiflexus sp.]|nr:ATP-binding protein [Roseiflexus sp.]MCS7291016.1 ATP-binding protein [Roseiflexus sp.]MDW8147478.1 ATP-binding protein [Roseiflexaceae bacterium]MDW8233430.1 ATP-binding protein [Roseiflexaceae bacterium]